MSTSRVSPLASAILGSWDKQRDLAQRLVADLSEDDMVGQPVRGVVMNHPAWVFGHLSIYPPVMAAILEGKPFEDPMTRPCARGTAPVADRAAYPSKAEIMRVFLEGHDHLAAVFARTSEEVFARPIPLARWKERFPLVGDAVIHLMLDHEAMHLGQVSAWRRACGLGAV